MTIKKNKLPRWDLKDLYHDPASKKLDFDFKKCRRDANAFHKRYFGNVAELSGDELVGAVQLYEKIDQLIARIMSYAQLCHSTDVLSTETSRFYQTTQETLTEISAQLVFFKIELKTCFFWHKIENI